MDMNMNISTTINSSNFATTFRSPLVTSTIKIKSETAVRSYNDLYHTFTLPVVGDYSHNFRLVSNYILKDYNPAQGVIAVDQLGNYINHIDLNLNNSGTVVSQIEGAKPPFSPISPISPISPPDTLVPTTEAFKNHVIFCNFLDLPLLTKCSTETNYQIMIKFTRSHPIEYSLVYDVMFVNDDSYSDLLQKEQFSISYLSRQLSNTSKLIHMSFNKGKIWGEGRPP